MSTCVYLLINDHSSAMSPITVFANTIHSDNGCIVGPIFLNIHFSGIVTPLPSRIVHFSISFYFL